MDGNEESYKREAESIREATRERETIPEESATSDGHRTDVMITRGTRGVGVPRGARSSLFSNDENRKVPNLSGSVTQYVSPSLICTLTTISSMNPTARLFSLGIGLLGSRLPSALPKEARNAQTVRKIWTSRPVCMGRRSCKIAGRKVSNPGVFVGPNMSDWRSPCALARPRSSWRRGSEAELGGGSSWVRIGRVGFRRDLSDGQVSLVVDFAIPLLRRGAGAFIVTVAGRSYLRSSPSLSLTMPSVVLVAKRASCFLQLGYVDLGHLTRVRSAVRLLTPPCLCQACSNVSGRPRWRGSSGNDPTEQELRRWNGRVLYPGVDPNELGLGGCSGDGLAEGANSGTNPGDLAERANSGEVADLGFPQHQVARPDEPRAHSAVVKSGDNPFRS
ncbi:hypothetical protein B296_00008169 [Ensete ventricosum]|uniref:Uncharacterized protein n=1 Tax=Ensete ventricosum TaxID=4639 RepID=A0A426YUG6_ENSVE|nr:hypothetical protein B296_00008169 [Ensete ventricosum]